MVIQVEKIRVEMKVTRMKMTIKLRKKKVRKVRRKMK